MIQFAELPEAARVRLADLSLAADAALDSTRASNARLQQQRPDGDDRVKDRLRAAAEAHGARHNALSRLLSTTQQWLASLPASAVLEVAPSADNVGLGPSEKLADALGNVRKEIADAKAALASVRSAPLPQADKSQLAEDCVVRLMRQGKVSVAIVADQLRLSFRGDMHAAEDVLAMMAWMAPDAVCRALEREIAALPERPGALPAAERIRRTVRLEAELLALERRESALMDRAHGDGLDVLPRPDMDPRAFLNVAVVTKEAQASAA